MSETLKLFIPPEEIRAIVQRLAREIKADYASKNPVLIGVLKGASVFLSDLIREIETPLEIDFMQTSSYGRRDTPSEKVAISREIASNIEGRDVVVVEGIVDRGKTIEAIIEYLSAKRPASIRICTLLLRDGGGSPGVRTDYVGATVMSGFVVGYGMDYKEHLRNLPAIYFLTGR